jgi:hypothetical protein
LENNGYNIDMKSSSNWKVNICCPRTPHL